MADNTIIVYSPSGDPERHTHANARDLVTGAGYTWARFVPASPAGYAPFARADVPEGSLSQRVLDRASGKEEGGASGAAGAAAQALAAQQAQIAQALAAQQAATAAAEAAALQEAARAAAADQAIEDAKRAAALAAATPEPEVKDFSAPAPDSSDLDEPEADAGDEDSKPTRTPRRRGGRKAS